MLPYRINAALGLTLAISLAFCGCSTAKRAGAVDPPPQKLFQDFPKHNKIDELVIATLEEQMIPPSERCSDEVFVRRVHVDAIGTLPTPQEVRSFLADTDPAKRDKLVDRLLARDEFADYWALKWGDLLRIKAEFPSNLWPNAAQAYHRWVRDSIRSRMPYDQFVRELLTSCGSNFRVPQVNFYRAFQERTPQQTSENVALVFMGIRLCDGSIDEERILGMSAFFAKVGYKNTDEWKEEIVYFNPEGKLLDPKTEKPAIPRTLDGKALDILGGTDPRMVFANWLTAPENPWFSRNIANRIWFWLMGRGIVHEADDMRPTNAPWNPELLAYLEKEVVNSKFDLRHIYRLILTSTAYQLSSETNRWNASDEAGFTHYRIRRIDAEPLIDAICQITNTTEKYSSNIPEPFTFLPNDQKAVTIADGSIDSPFLELFGRPSRNSSYESERSSTPSVLQAQHLLNSSHVQKKLEQSWPLKQMVNQKKKPAQIAEELYLRILSRFPTEDEKKTAVAYMASPKRKLNESVCDVAWALLNSKEFILKH